MRLRDGLVKKAHNYSIHTATIQGGKFKNTGIIFKESQL